jgi:hypothetical protein
VIQQGICSTWNVTGDQELRVNWLGPPVLGRGSERERGETWRKGRGLRIRRLRKDAGEVAEARGRLIAGLELALGEVDAAAVEAAGGAGFEALHVEAEVRRLSDRVEMLSPMRPPAWFCWPTWRRPRMKVPEEMMTALAR